MQSATRYILLSWYISSLAAHVSVYPSNSMLPVSAAGCPICYEMNIDSESPILMPLEKVRCFCRTRICRNRTCCNYRSCRTTAEKPKPNKGSDSLFPGYVTFSLPLAGRVSRRFLRAMVGPWVFVRGEKDGNSKHYQFHIKLLITIAIKPLSMYCINVVYAPTNHLETVGRGIYVFSQY